MQVHDLRPPHRAVPLQRSVLLLLACLLCLHTGCVTSKKYRWAKSTTPPAKTLNWSAAGGPVDLTLQSVIVFHGPGSWKRHARWDEYVVQVVNRGTQPVTLSSAALIDFQGDPQFPGNEPWALEKLSYTNWEKYGKTGVQLLAGAGAVLVYGATAEAAVMGSILGGGSTTGALVLVEAIPIVAIVDITAVAIINHHNKKKVQEEFNRRRLVLARSIAPGGVAVGSLFFPMTPGPRSLHLKGMTGTVPFELALELTPLAGLHLKPARK